MRELWQPPRKLTLDEYVRQWQPQGWELLVTDRNLNYRPEWGMWEAIRDIVQNALDEAEHYKWGYDQHGLWIRDEGSGVLIRDFLMGAERQKPEWMRGRYGEGMKIAALALMREGYQVHVMTKGREMWSVLYPVKVQVTPPAYENCICFLWRENGSAKGTTWHIHGYTGSAYEGLFSVNLPRSMILAEVPSGVMKPKQRYNQLIRAEGPAKSDKGGVVYCRDIYLMDIVSPFSYNLWGFSVAPDRHAPESETDMLREMGWLWCGVGKVSLLKILLRMLVDPASETVGDTIEHTSMIFDPTWVSEYKRRIETNKATWQQAWNEVVGKNKVVHTDSRYDSMVQHLGYVSQSIVPRARTGVGLVIKTDQELIQEMSERLDKAQRVADSSLTETQFTHLKLARLMAEEYHRIGKVYAAIIPPASDFSGRTAGLYEFDTANIKISPEMLDRVRTTVEVMVHELGHHQAYTGAIYRGDDDPKSTAGDLTRGHANAMEKVAGDVFLELHHGKYDKVLTDVNW